MDEVTESYFAVVTPEGRYRYVCDGWPMRNPVFASLYDSIEDVHRYGRTWQGDVIEPVVFTARYWIMRSSG